MTLVLAALAARPFKEGMRGTAYDRYKRSFHATPDQVALLEPLVADGGGQLLWMRYRGSSTLARLVGAADASLDLQLATTPDAPDRLFDLGTLDDRARAIFDWMPHNHPRGHVPDWTRQPDHLHEVFRRFARGDAPIPR